MPLVHTPSATASQLLDLYLSLQGFALVGPDDLQGLGVEPEQLKNVDMRVPVHWALHLWQRAASHGARRRSACWLANSAICTPAGQSPNWPRRAPRWASR